MKFRFGCNYHGRPEPPTVFEMDDVQKASEAAEAMVQDREQQGGKYSDYYLERIDQEEKTTAIPIAGLHDGPPCDACGSFMMQSGIGWWKCTHCGNTTATVRIVSD